LQTSGPSGPSGLPANALELRLHAPSLSAAAVPTLRALREQGLRLLLEGVGQGSATLSALAQLPATAVSIDRHFVRQAVAVEAHRVLVKAIVSLGATLGLVALADGVDTEEQRATMLELGVTLGQGALFAQQAEVAEAVH
jgi:EAL domain-containing protein (putative c-di-GMP-specific phosphodiesterase class I)